MKEITGSNVEFVTYEQFKAHYDAIDEEMIKDFDKHDANNDGKLDIRELGEWHKVVFASESRDGSFVEDELKYMLNELTGFRHDEHGQDIKHYTSIEVSLADAKEHPKFFILTKSQYEHGTKYEL